MQGTPPLQLLRQAAVRFRALGDENRLRLLAILKDGERNVRALTEECGLSQASASKHLAVLRNAGLVGSRREGASVFYFVRDESIHDLCDIVCAGVRRHAREAHEALEGAATPDPFHGG